MADNKPKLIAWPTPIDIAACASIGAGGIHAAVIGIHAEHRVLAMLFVWSAAIQVAWGIAVLRRATTALVATGLITNAVFAGAWFITRVTSVSWIGGLEEREPIKFADAACAGLAVVTVGVALGVLLTPGALKIKRASNLGVAAFCVAALALPAMMVGGTTAHEDGVDGHGHGTNPDLIGEVTPSADTAPDTAPSATGATGA